MEMMERSGCDFTLEVCQLRFMICTLMYCYQVSKIPAIIETIVLHEALHKLKPFLDSFGDGLQVLGVKDMICHFPEVFKSAFVFSGEVTPLDVLRILHPRPNENEINEGTKHIWKYVTTFIEAADSDGNIELVYKMLFYYLFSYRVEGLSPVCYWCTSTERENFCNI